mgnify:FL=1
MVGNPLLQPSFSTIAKLSHTYKQFFTSSLSFDRVQNDARYIMMVDNASNQQVTTYQNFVTREFYDFTNTVSFEPWQWLNNMSTIMVWYASAHSSTPQVAVNSKGLGAYFYTNNSLSLNKSKTWLADLSLMYIFPSTDGIYHISDVSKVDVGLKFTPTKKTQVALNAVDVFRSGKFNVNSLVNRIDQRIFYFPDNQFVLSVSYKFGNNSIKQDESYRDDDDQQRSKKKKGLF